MSETTAGADVEADIEAEVEAKVDGADETSVTVDVETLAVEIADLRPALEAILMVADQALDKVQLASVVGHPVEAVQEALDALAAEYTDQGRGFELRHVAGGWRFYTRDEFAGVVESFVLEGQQARLTQAALETLAVVAYKQPVSRARVSAVRGVSVDGVMRTLLQPLPHHDLLPRPHRHHLPRGAARAGAVPPGHGGSRGRADADRRGATRARARGRACR